MAIKTNYVGGDTYAAVDHNDENLQTLKNAKIISNGISIRNNIYSAPWFYSDDGDILAHYTTSTTIYIYDAKNKKWQTRNLTSDWADAGDILGIVFSGSDMYVLLRKITATTENRVYLFDPTDLSAGGTQLTATFFGTNICEMAFDGTDFYFTHDAGDDATNDHEILRASISGTTLTEEEVITCGSTSGYFDYFAVDDTYIYAADASSPYYLRKYNKSGVLQDTTDFSFAASGLINVSGDILYISSLSSVFYFTKIPV